MLTHGLSSSHQDLQPDKHQGKLTKLWSLFCDMARRTLVTIGIVHADIRPGYDLTSNILLCLHEDDAASSSDDQGDEEMVLIDLDSLIRLTEFLTIDLPGYLDKTNLNPFSCV